MRIGLISWGTEGDVRPFYALARGLAARGHTVRFDFVNVEGRTFEALGESTGVAATQFGREYFLEHRDEIRRASEESLKYASPP
jgi:UDP:flavonoid glycosyltransferase YjiC (YdhE family)